MCDKSYVSMEQKICPVCGVPHDTGAILLDRHLKDTFQKNTVTGMAFCPEHQKLRDDGYIALVECDVEKSTVKGGMSNPEDVYRLGRIAHVKREVFHKLFDKKSCDSPLIFVDSELMDKLENNNKEN